MPEQDKEQLALTRLQYAGSVARRFTGKPLVITYSGGKDSEVLLHLAEKSGVEFEAQHSLTTVDAPETMYHIKEQFHRLEDKGVRCHIDDHPDPSMPGGHVTMWNLIVKHKTPPTRVMRYCCSTLKEASGTNRYIATGVRWAESVSRKKKRGVLEIQRTDPKKNLILTDDNDESRQIYEVELDTCSPKGKRVVNPIVDWTDADVRDYIRSEHLQLNPLYECGFKRVGCIGCPMAAHTTRRMELFIYPQFYKAYLNAFDKMLEARKMSGLKSTGWDSAQDVMDWWLSDEKEYRERWASHKSAAGLLK